MSRESINITINADQVAEIYWALVARNDVLIKEKNDNNTSLGRIAECQFKRNNDALRLIEDTIREMNYS